MHEYLPEQTVAGGGDPAAPHKAEFKVPVYGAWLPAAFEDLRVAGYVDYCAGQYEFDLVIDWKLLPRRRYEGVFVVSSAALRNVISVLAKLDPTIIPTRKSAELAERNVSRKGSESIGHGQKPWHPKGNA